MSRIQVVVSVGLGLMSFGLTSCTGTEGSADATPPEVDIEFCLFSVPEPFRTGHGDFAVVATFTITEEGRLDQVEVVTNPARIDEDAIRRCLGSWNLPVAEPSSEGAASFTWHHNRGWDSLVLTVRSFSQRIRLSGGSEGEPTGQRPGGSACTMEQ